jgi:hypothetical protein
MRRAFRVAAAFTGAAAGAAPFTPAAAAPAQHAMLRDIGGRLYNCTPAMAQWIHFYWEPQAHHGPQCMSGSSHVWTHPQKYLGFCTGDAYGTIVISGSSFPYGPDQITAFNGNVSAISVSRVAGHYNCPNAIA